MFIFFLVGAPKGSCCDVYLIGLHSTHVNTSRYNWSTWHFPTSGKKLPPPRGRDSASRCSCSVKDQTEALAAKSPCQAPRVGAVAVRPSRPPRLHAAASGASGPSRRNAAPSGASTPPSGASAPPPQCLSHIKVETGSRFQFRYC